jgi:hypothetical protein
MAEWQLGDTGMDPNTQDYMRINESSNARNLAYLQDKFKREQIQSVARMGAERLAALGPEGQQWAQRLISDPYAAYAMAEQYGGFQAIEFNLMRQAAINNPATPPMNPISQQSFIESGPQGLALTGQSRANEALAGRHEATSEVMRRLLEGRGAGGSAGGSPDLDTISALGFVDSDAARVQLAIRKARREPEEKALARIQTSAEPLIQELGKTAEDWGFIRDIDFVNNPANDAYIGKLFIRMVEPGLQVTQNESGDATFAATSGIDQLGMNILRTLTISGKYTPTTRRMMIESINNAMASRAKTKLSVIEGLEAEAGEILGGENVGINVQRALIGDDSPRAILNEYINSPIDYDSIGPAFNAESRDSLPPVPPGPKMDRYGNPVDAKWDSDRQEFYWDMPD